jgi:spore coat protein A
VDFSRLAGRTAVLKNLPPRPPVVTPAAPLVEVMEIRVASGTPVDPVIPDELVGGSLPALEPTEEKRFVTLNETGVDTPEWKLTLNGGAFMGEEGDDIGVEEDEVEEWYYVNLTGDTHPMHHHLFMSQLIGRVPFDAARYAADAPSADFGVTGIDPEPYYTAPLQPPEPWERGWRDTVMAHPGQVTIIRARFELPSTASGPQTYVHHCHIVEHEDNDMMRTFTVG